MRIRLTGRFAEVDMAAARIADVVTVLETSRPYPRRGNSALLSLYLETILDAPAEGGPITRDTDSATDRAASDSH
ncbi:hypothetical protein E1281_31665 [Actinomadura sp. KC345]|uniref:hypothetical protein n=1 Tax=Actinomadura sp. KC345 TaxID=2530371 RepID=UPI0010520273|nr:hypothetical protein [Actinomadura sp. KC345]TDC45050.1 hypothetical protein E1281_31665 [Actinomadura sp. KC345]